MTSFDSRRDQTDCAADRRRTRHVSRAPSRDAVDEPCAGKGKHGLLGLPFYATALLMLVSAAPAVALSIHHRCSGYPSHIADTCRTCPE